MNEANCEKNMETFLKCIDAVAGATYGTGFAAIKLTALGRPGILMIKVLFIMINYVEKLSAYCKILITIIKFYFTFQFYLIKL